MQDELASHYALGRRELVGALVVIALSLAFALRPRRDTRNLPPGPPPGFSGNKIPSHMWLYFHELGKQYGPVVTVWLGNQPFIICTTYKAVQDLMERKSNATSDRPKSVIAGEVLSGDMRTGVVGYGDKWRRLRKALHVNLTPLKSETYQPRQLLASHQVLKDILGSPRLFKQHIRSYAATVIMSLAYGKNERSTYQSAEIKKVVACLNRFHAAAQPGHFAIDSHPWLRYVPGYLSQHRAWHREELALFKEQFEGVRTRMQTASDFEPCFASYIVENQAEYKLNDDEAAYLVGSLFGAGSDTTVSALTIVFLAAVAFPEQLKVVQDELDRVVGRDRPPTFDDWEDLPETWAFVLESYRWRPVLPAGLAHAVTETFSYEGFVIPKGAIITGNTWSVHRDPALYTDPEEFQPSRWLLKKDGITSINRELKHTQFGFGRRICAGLHVADRSVFINSASIMWAFNISPACDDSGKPIPLDLSPKAFDDAVTTHPLPFEVDFTPRFAQTAKVIANLESFGA
ncbi:cytochrome P450 [Leucosporidium creatinivorum]|uniref:Cytochrome P450 n=1 Tax=Leucosporidium creatinivorum TaxID=106004 RepID=A0A1Y2G5F7_9BASI|nr:cytochrome P450 [Leucosporidium creatinivorum]